MKNQPDLKEQFFFLFKVKGIWAVLDSNILSFPFKIWSCIVHYLVWPSHEIWVWIIVMPLHLYLQVYYWIPSLWVWCENNFAASWLKVEGGFFFLLRHGKEKEQQTYQIMNHSLLAKASKVCRTKITNKSYWFWG